MNGDLQLKKRVKRRGQTGRFIAIDTETTGGDFITPYINQLTGKPFKCASMPYMITACDDVGMSWAWRAPVDPQTRFANWSRCRLVRKCQETVNRPSSLGHIESTIFKYPVQVIHNGPFDIPALRVIGIDLDTDRVHDTLPASHVLDSKESHGAKDLGIKYLEMTDVDEDLLKEEVIRARREARKQKIPIGPGDDPDSKVYTDFWLPYYFWKSETDAVYGERDAIRASLLWRLFRKELVTQNLWQNYEREREVIPIAIGMKDEGLPVRITRAVSENEAQEQIRDKYQSELSVVAGPDFNPLSRQKQLPEFLYKELALPVVKKTPLRAPSSDKEALELLTGVCMQPAETGKVSYRNAVLLWGKRNNPKKKFDNNGFRRVTAAERKWAHKRTDSLLNLIGFFKASTNCGYLRSYVEKAVDWGDHTRVHGSYNPWGTDATRWSASNPNLQQVGKRGESQLRVVFGPPPGWEMYCFDWSQLELRTGSKISGDPTLRRVLTEGLDMHQLTADLFGIPRWMAKNINFAWMYGAGDAKLSRMAGTDASTFRDGMASAYPGVMACMDETIQFVEKHGCIYTLFGYRLAVQKSKAYVGFNAKSQGSAGDICKNSMIEIWREVLNFGRAQNIKIVACIHDELIFLVRKGTSQAKLLQILKIMESAGEGVGLETPVNVSKATAGTNWQDVKEVKLAA